MLCTLELLPAWQVPWPLSLCLHVACQLLSCECLTGQITALGCQFVRTEGMYYQSPAAGANRQAANSIKLTPPQGVLYFANARRHPSMKLVFQQLRHPSLAWQNFYQDMTLMVDLQLQTMSVEHRRRCTRITEDLAISPMQVDGSHEVALAQFQQCAGLVECPATYRFCGQMLSLKASPVQFLSLWSTRLCGQPAFLHALRNNVHRLGLSGSICLMGPWSKERSHTSSCSSRQVRKLAASACTVGRLAESDACCEGFGPCGDPVFLSCIGARVVGSRT